MKKTRTIGFIITILIGIALGIGYGWGVNPVGVTNTNLASLRVDYKTDYVLMVAENFASDGDVEEAVVALDLVNPGDSLVAVRSALQIARQLGYSAPEILFMAELERALTSTLSEGSAP